VPDPTTVLHTATPTASPAVSAAPPMIRVERSRGWVSLRLRDLWLYRELVYFLAWRDVKVRYKQTVLGAAWALLQPLLTMVVFSLFFGRLAHMPSEGVPYPLFTFAALVPWTFFSNGLTQSSNSLIGSANLITKVYFPRLIVPIATVLSGVIDFLLAFVLLVGMMAYYHIAPAATVVWLPLFLLLAVIAALGSGLWLSAMNVQFRDVRYTVPFLTQVWLFATPIAYPSSLLHEPWRTLFAINPMVGAVEGFRWALFAHAAPPVAAVAMSFASASVVFVTGALYFRRMERTFADIV
jgi:homopolymeric O-antigen transport system permease protein